MKQPIKLLFTASHFAQYLALNKPQLTSCSIINSHDHIKVELNSFYLNGHTQGIIYDSTKTPTYEKEIHSLILTVFFFSVLVRWQCLLHPTTILSILSYWFSKTVWKWNICKLSVIAFNFWKHKETCTEDGKQHQMQLPFCLAC